MSRWYHDRLCSRPLLVLIAYHNLLSSSTLVSFCPAEHIDVSVTTCAQSITAWIETSVMQREDQLSVTVNTWIGDYLSVVKPSWYN